MELITKRSLIKSTPERWKMQYEREIKSGNSLTVRAGSKSRKETYDLLCKLDLDKCSESDIRDIIGNDSWTSLRCDECGLDSDICVAIGSGAGGEYSPEEICFKCIIKAVRLCEDNWL